jgi:hypothetical protein
MNNRETWRAIPDWSNYEVSNKGRVRKQAFIIKKDKTGAISYKRQIVKQHYNAFGYCTVYLSQESKRKNFLVHRLVGFAWIDNLESKPHINHIDGNKKNNNVSNLEWVTPKENSRHAITTGLKYSKKYADKYSENQLKIKERGLKEAKEAIKPKPPIVKLKPKYNEGHIMLLTLRKGHPARLWFNSIKECASYLGVTAASVSAGIKNKSCIKRCFRVYLQKKQEFYIYKDLNA